MNCQPESMNFPQAFKIADQAVYDKTGKHLTDVENIVLMGSWERKTYSEIAEDAGYSLNHLQRDVGSKLFRKLSQALGEEVKKTSFRAALERRQDKINQSQNLVIEFPTRPLALNSQFYINRSPLEELCYQEILRDPGCLIRIKAPARMGKTSLLRRIIARAKQQGYQTVRISLRTIDRESLTDLDRFLKWLCKQITSALKLEEKLEQYWSKSSITGCKIYFQNYLLPQIASPLVLAFDEMERLFKYPEMIDFFALLRSWHEEANNLEIWQKLRLIVVHSTEPFIPLDINKSPFENVGLPIKLPPFNLQQVQQLAKFYQLSFLTSSEIEKLQEMLGGHPYLIQLAFYHLHFGDVTLPQLLEEAPTPAGIYSDHLRGLLETLKENSQLVEALQQIWQTDATVPLEPKLVYYLECMGLVQINGNHVKLICELYRLYFRQYLS